MTLNNKPGFYGASANAPQPSALRSLIARLARYLREQFLRSRGSQVQVLPGAPNLATFRAWPSWPGNSGRLLARSRPLACGSPRSLESGRFGIRARIPNHYLLLAAIRRARSFEVEDRAILVHTGSVWCLGVHVRDKVFRRDDALGDSILPTGSMAENAQDATASVRILDAQDRVPVDSLAICNVIDKRPSRKISEFPACEPRYLVRAASRWGARTRTAAIGDP